METQSADILQSTTTKSTAWISIKKATGLQQLAGTTAFEFMTQKLSRFMTLYSQPNKTVSFYLVYRISGITISDFTFHSCTLFCAELDFSVFHVLIVSLSC